MQSLENALKYTGGVEEEKEEREFSPDELRGKESSDTDHPDVGDEKGFRAQLEEFSRLFLGSCGNVLEAASLSLGCRWNEQAPPRNKEEARQPLSIAEELKKIAAREGPIVRPRAPDIPRFLGEDAVYSFEDDNVSAISQHTLEEMARKGFVHPMCRSNGSHGSNRTPSPGRTRSSTSSSKVDQAEIQL